MYVDLSAYISSLNPFVLLATYYNAFLDSIGRHNGVRKGVCPIIVREEFLELLHPFLFSHKIWKA